MKKMRFAPALPLVSALAFAGSMPSALAGTPEERMTRGKLAADLGDQRVAEELFAGVAADAAVPANARAEALVRLGVVRRALGKTQSSAAAFQKAMQSPARDADVTRLLTLAIAGVAPDRARWSNQWPKVRLASQPGATTPQLSIQWPGPGPQGLRKAFPARDPVTLDLEDVSLIALVHHLIAAWRQGGPGPRATLGFENWPESYQAPEAVQHLEFVIHSGVGGFGDVTGGPRVTVKATSMPWNELFENVLASNGLGFVLDKNLLFIARVEDLGAIERVRGRAYGGHAINLHFLTARLLDGPMGNQDGGVLSLFSQVTDIRFVPDANLQGMVTLKVSERPAMQVLDLVLLATDLAATRTPAPPDAPPGTTALRISKLANVKGDTVDLSKLVPASPSP